MKKYRIFWTCILPDHLIARYGLSFAACNFSYNLMSDCAFDKVYSSMPLIGSRCGIRFHLCFPYATILHSFLLENGLGYKPMLNSKRIFTITHFRALQSALTNRHALILALTTFIIEL